MALSPEIIIFFLCLFISILRYPKNLYFKYLPYFIILTFMSIRYNYGDGESYRIIFKYIKDGVDVYGIEPLYVLLNKISPDFDLIIIFTSIAFVLAIFFVISRTLNYRQRGLALLVMTLHPYILMVNMSAIRQSIAIILFLVGVYIANNYKKIYFLPFVLLGFLFHKSAIVLLPIFFIINKQYFSTKIKMIIFLCTILFVSLKEILFRLVEFLMVAFGLNNVNYISYLNNGNENSSLSILLSFLVMIFFMLFGDAVERKNAVYVKLSILAMVFEALQGSVQQFGRISMYFLPFLMLSIPLILRNNNNQMKIKFFNKSFILNYKWCCFVEVLFIFIFIWKLIGFMTPYFAYHTVFEM